MTSIERYVILSLRMLQVGVNPLITWQALISIYVDRTSRGAWFWRRSGKYEIKERPKSCHATGNYRKITQEEDSEDEKKLQISKRTVPPSPPVRSPLTRLQTVPSQSDMRLEESDQTALGEEMKSVPIPTANNHPHAEIEYDVHEGQNGNTVRNNLNQQEERESAIVI